MFRWLSGLRIVIRSVVFRGRVERDLEQELQYHLEQEINERLKAGLSPEKARYAALRAMDSIRHRTSLALRLNVFVLVPASVGLAILGVPLVALLFERGQFGADSVQQTAIALTFFMAWN